MIRVLIAEDSLVERELLIRILSTDREIQVIGVVGDGEAAIKAVQHLKPDVVTMDIHMPKLNGIEATRYIMKNSPLPIIIVTNSYDPETTYHSFEAIEAGALAIVKKPVWIGHSDHAKEAATLISYIKMMSEIKVIRRFGRLPIESGPAPELVIKPPVSANIRVVAIGASTGGPAVIGKILTGLPREFPVPLLIVQHMTLGFLNSFVNWLRSISGYTVRIAVHGEAMIPGTAYFAPEDYHLTVGSEDRIMLTKEPPEYGIRPSVARLFDSVGKYYGEGAMGILLTGMGSDGARELKAMRDRGAVTVAQDSGSSIVFGMPGEAVKLGAAQYVLDPDHIINLLSKLKG